MTNWEIYALEKNTVYVCKLINMHFPILLTKLSEKGKILL